MLGEQYEKRQIAGEARQVILAQMAQLGWTRHSLAKRLTGKVPRSSVYHFLHPCGDKPILQTRKPPLPGGRRSVWPYSNKAHHTIRIDHLERILKAVGLPSSAIKRR